jgi:hypothetical protein
MASLQPSKSCHPPSLLTLPPEILDQIFLTSCLIPDQIWISTCVTPPTVHLNYFVTDVGSQFCVQRFSLNNLVISKQLHTYLRRLLASRTTVHLGRAREVEWLLSRPAGNSIAAWGLTRISISLEHAGRTDVPFDTYQDLFRFLRRTFLSTLRVLEIKLDFNTFANAHAHWHQAHRLDPWPPDARTPSRLNTVTLLQGCLLAFATCGDPNLLCSANPGPLPLEAPSDTVFDLEIRVPCLEREARRHELLTGSILGRHYNSRQIWWSCRLCFDSLGSKKIASLLRTLRPYPGDARIPQSCRSTGRRR